MLLRTTALLATLVVTLPVHGQERPDRARLLALRPAATVASAHRSVALGAVRQADSPEARERFRFVTNASFYADDGEFFNDFREGETLLGTAATFAVDVVLTDRVTFRGGLFLNHRFGSEHFAEQWRPVLRLTLESPSGWSRFILGTLETAPRDGSFGPDLDGPHRLLPPLQAESLGFTRPYEAGLQWLLRDPRVEQDAWISWQRLNTPEHRERFDAGVRGRVRLDRTFAIGYQFHHVHEGGQLFDSGPITDSFAGGPGMIITPRIAFFDSVSIDSYFMWSTSSAGREIENGVEHGHGVFVRAALTKDGWRGHFIAWGACDWLKEEGDSNYSSWLRGGNFYRGTRHYGEIGLTKVFYRQNGVDVDGAFRVHRVEKEFDYSFRVVASVDFALPLGQ